MFKKLTVSVSLVIFCGAFWTLCPWFATLKDLPPASSGSCCCEKCVDDCVGVDGDACCCWTCDETGCHKDQGCSCPNCIPSK